MQDCSLLFDFHSLCQHDKWLYPCLSILNAFSFTSEIGKLRKNYLIFSFREKLNGLYFEELLLKKDRAEEIFALVKIQCNNAAFIKTLICGTNAFSICLLRNLWGNNSPYTLGDKSIRAITG